MKRAVGDDTPTAPLPTAGAAGSNVFCFSGRLLLVGDDPMTFDPLSVLVGLLVGLAIRGRLTLRTKGVCISEADFTPPNDNEDTAEG
jgi:hypothetical protein